MLIGTVTLWRAKRQVEANLEKVTAARVQERQAFEGAFGIDEMVTVPLLRAATEAKIWDEDRIRQSYQLMVGVYDRIARTPDPDVHQFEVVVKATRRVGALRMTLGDRRGLDDYARAIDLYKAMTRPSGPARLFPLGKSDGVLRSPRS